MAKKVKKTEVSYEILQVYMFLNKEHSKVFARVSWNDNPPKDEVRSCWEKDGELKLGKGIALSQEEITALYKYLNDNGLDYEKPDREPVDFSEIFRSSEGIMEKRRDGAQTKDGFTVLGRKGDLPWKK